MTFQIHALPTEAFADLWTLSDAELTARNACRMAVDASPGFPCRISLQDAPLGEEVILVNHISLDHASPFRASHAVFVRRNVPTARPDIGEVPTVLATRLLSIRAFDGQGMMLNADVVEGADLSAALKAMFAQEGVAEVHIHNAKQGCYAARATRA